MSTRKGSRVGKKSWLKTLELGGTTQNNSLETFMRFIPNDLKYTGTFTFDPSSAIPSDVSQIMFEANVLSPKFTAQRWKFQIHSFATKKGITLSSNKKKTPLQWNVWVRKLSGSFSDFLNPNGYVKIRQISNNSNGILLVDYLKLSLIVGTAAPTPSPVSSPASRLESMSELTYMGAFRLNSGTYGDSNVNYAIGILAYSPTRNSIFITGHAHHNAIAEFPVPELGIATLVSDLPVATPIQKFQQYFNTLPNEEGINRITGIWIQDGQLIVNAENWYDAAGDNVDTTFVVRNATDLQGDFNGFFRMTGAAHSSGYMGSIPSEWQASFGGAKSYTGWSSVHSITSRYSQGPSLWAFDSSGILDSSSSPGDSIPATAYMNFPYSYSGDSHISEGALLWAEQGTVGPFDPADPLWNPLAEGVYGFFVPGSSTFLVIGSTAGLETGIGYKAVQEDGNQCGGPCAFGPNDYYNYYWMFDINEILSADTVSSPRPYAYGIWDVPFDDYGRHSIIGAAFSPPNLYVALANAGQVGTYDRPPLIVSFTVPSLQK